MSKIYVGIGAIILIALAAGYFLVRPSPVPIPEPEVQLEDKVVEENEPYYTIRAVYSDGAPPSVEEAILDTVAHFKEDSGLDTLTPEDIKIQGLGENRKYSLSISYKRYESAATISYVFSIYQDTLGAHPNSFFRTLTFRKDDSREVELKDLFVIGDRYLDRLSTLAYERVSEELKNRTGAEPTPEMLDGVRLGTAPSPEALQFFYLEGESLHLLFPPYQVAAYAAGSFDIEIPLRELEDIRSPDLH